MLQRPKGPNGSFTDDQIRKAKAYALEVNAAAFVKRTESVEPENSRH
jgi:hypothetical protein